MKSKILILTLFFMTTLAFSQTVNVSGTVTDAGSIPLPGVNVIVKNTAKGASTDFDGLYALNEVPVNSILVFSYIGFQTQEILVTSDSTTINVVLQEDAAQLDEVVVIGYGTQKKKEITGAVSVISTESIEKLKPTRVEQALQGQVAGVNITTNSGSPGSGATISIRGVSTNGDSRPLILVDGNVVENLEVVDPNTIESINVLKDATAGIYGVRAANGVILIKTKTGRKEMPLTVEYNAYAGIQQTTRKMPVLNATEYALIVNEAVANGGGIPPYTNISDLGVGTDWQDEVFQTAPIQEHSISFRGGKEKSSYSYSGSFLTQDGIVGSKKSNFTRFVNAATYNLDILENVRFKSGLTLTRTNRRSLPENTLGSVLFNALNIAPTIPVRDELGAYSLADGLGAEVINPLAQIANTYNRGRGMKLNGFAGLSYNFLEHFTAEANYQFNYAEGTYKNFSPIVNYGLTKVQNIVRSSFAEGINYFRDYTFDAFVKYERTFNDTHKVNALLGTSVFETSGGNGEAIIGRDIIGNNIANATEELAGEIEDVWRLFDRRPVYVGRLLSYFARVQYDYKGKYLFSGVIRRDGSTRFPPGSKFGYFPSGSIGWVVSDEDFMSENNFFDLLKVRASYGVLGNDRIGDYRFVSQLNGEGTYFFGGNDLEDEAIGTAAGAIPNPIIQWEKQKTLNIGLDMRILDSKVNITTDYFIRRTEDLLVSPEVSGLLGTGAPPVVNAGIVENKGIEFAIGYSDTIGEDFKFNVNYNVTAIKNEVVSVSGEGEVLEGGGFGISQPAISRMEAGFPLGYFIGYETDGIFQSQEEINNSAVTNIAPQPGDWKFVDQNGDGIIDLDDRVDLGNPLPAATMGLNLSFDYKNWDFAAYAFASLGNEIVRNYERNLPFTNKPNAYLDRWTGPGSTNSAPRVTTGATSNISFSDFYVEDGSFVRLQNAQLGYTFSSDDESKIDKLRLYVSGNNLFTLTEYSGYDPTAGTGAPIGGGIDQGFTQPPEQFF